MHFVLFLLANINSIRFDRFIRDVHAVSDRVAEARQRAGLQSADHKFSAGRTRLLPRGPASRHVQDGRRHISTSGLKPVL